MVIFEESKQKKKLEEVRKKEEEDRVKLLSAKYKIPYQDLLIVPIDSDALKIVPESKARAGEMAVVQKVGKNLQIGVRNPIKPDTQKILEELTRDRYSYKLFLVSLRSLEHAWKIYQEIPKELGIISGEIKISEEGIKKFRSTVQSIENINFLLKNLQTKSITDALEIIIGGALAVEASDVHIEQQADAARLRYRLDGVLHDLTDIPSNVYRFLISRIKLISNLKLNVRDKGQDGRFTIKLEGTEIEVRTSTLPGPYGENIVMRILDPRTIALELEDLGMQPWIHEQINKELKRPHGMILTTGPTGSGKTTTLYAFLKKIHNPEIKIITLEDPIEYHLKGVEQTQVRDDKKYTFASGLRSILRQDPDVILLGEIRDFETAETAMNAALTGHLVFSTLHTNNAAGTIPRIVDIGVKPTIIAPAINVAMAQRLIRKLCVYCRQARDFTKEEINEINEEFKKFPPSVEKPDIKNAKTYSHAKNGCEKCRFTGYKGRLGIFEIFLVDSRVEKVILSSPSVADMEQVMFEQNQINMKQDGVLKVVAGITDLAELIRVTG